MPDLRPSTDAMVPTKQGSKVSGTWRRLMRNVGTVAWDAVIVQCVAHFCNGCPMSTLAGFPYETRVLAEAPRSGSRAT